MIARRISEIPISKTMELDAKAKALIKKGEDVINLTAGEPDFPTPEPVLEAAKSFLEKGQIKYTDPRGIYELREAIAKKVGERYGKEISPDQVVVTNGAKQALFNTFMALLDPGDEVIVFSPVWVSYIPQILLAGGTVKVVETFMKNDFHPSLEEVEGLLVGKTKAVLINSPNNPTGVVYSRSFLEGLLRLSEEMHFYIVSDEVYDSLVYTDNYTSILDIAKDFERVVYINGFSKSHSMTGWRVGYLISNRELASAVSKIQSHTTSCINTVAQYAALKAIEVDNSHMVQVFKERRDLVVERLKKMGVKFVEPQGAFYLFFKVPGDDVKFCERLLEEKKVALVPGSSFLKPGFVRLSFAISTERLAEALDRIEDFLNSH
ncbi:aspartate aminotransferase [Thermotoga neapolitana]|uniref:Aminotransferase n=1 Tax=Thermotoga neapolitana (strain ATCC 49049 / DSM 4359 / NBRC 107923 / NS-E) TaxID=309803 RepID=B9K962_THENN|nr:aspartate aminotransferase [Thermotoga neapolitana]ACM23495.1 Aspartate aminotransferase [Thermotoga neapolitana DSM 4359]HBF10158.1 pyridoxal phosphate-dependent aminotransferase [Thermotoga neapolitana]